MLVVGLTGSIGCGKSTVGRLFTDLGARLVDADQLARQAVAPDTPGLARVVAAFGPHLLLPGGALNRRLLAEEIFSDPGKKRLLEAILHPEVARGQKAFLATLAAREPDAVAILEIPLLFETGAESRCDRTIAVLCGPRQNARLAARQLDPALLEAIRQSQLDEAEKARRAEEILDNSGPLEETASQVARLMARLRPLPGRVWPQAWRAIPGPETP